MYYFILIPIIISLITGLALIKHVKPVFLNSIIILLALTLATEGIAIYFNLNPNTQKYINFVYNGFSLLDITVWFYVFYKIHSKPKIRIFILISSLLILAYSIIDLQFYQNWKFIHANSMRLYSLTIIFLSIVYLNGLLAINYHNLFLNPFFYVCSACIMYHAVLFGNLTILAENKNTYLAGVHDIFIILQNIANCLYYFLLCCTFIVCYLTRHSKHPMVIPESSYSMDS